MIKLHNLDKFFNKNKTNEIHVLNDISLTLPKTGLVVLLGPSGSGKTTLLNVLGGLDKIQSGMIDFDGQEIQGYKSRTWDNIRNEHIGYVFQNYNLMYDQTVYDNIALSLKMVGITEKEEIDKRIDYLLENVGMINYRRRRAANLSGGQQQRVAIARALAKNPKVIIADEPTGNLDSKNTYDIMNILRAISKNKLVVLVTHEENIADLYADRIIRLRDGQIISDDENQSIGGVDVQLETDIYLKDMIQVTDYKQENTSYKVYSDEITDSNFDVKLIVKNKTLYVQVDSSGFKRVNLLGNDSEVKVFDSHFVGQEIEEFSQTEFNLNEVVDDSKKSDQRAVINIKEAIRLGFGQFRNMGRMKVFQHILFFLNAVVVGIALALLFNAYTVDNLDFMREPVNTVEVVRDTETFDDFLSLEDPNTTGYLNLLDEISMQIKLPKLFQASSTTREFNYDVVHAELLDPSTLVVGRAVENQNEVVISKHYYQTLLQDSTFESLGIQTAEDFLTLHLYYSVATYDGTEIIEVDIVGIADIDDPVFYMKEESAWQVKSGFAVYEIYEDLITINEGVVTNTYDRMIVKDSDSLPSQLSEVERTIFAQGVTAEATFTTTEDVPDYLVKLKTLKEANYAGRYNQNGSKVYFLAADPEAAVAEFTGSGFSAEWDYTELRSTFLQAKILNSVGFIMFAGVFLGAAFIGTFFMMRSSLLSRIYEVSVYRALGAPKGDLRKVFFIETFIVTIFTSLLGYLAISYVLYRIQLVMDGIPGFDVIKVTPISFVGGLLIVFLVNVISGMLPISNLLRRTPAEIISKYDF